ncbi:hypothetical protein [Flavobacterium hydrophilum]|uniref:hypothetical protein n=1 Tax=Flavobacterium hydrophilum TaxID=2211445 RepID=UPI00140240C8|nr:hypothetical protein [Flavobacterium hydrophilum]
MKSKKEEIFQIDHPFDVLIHSVLNTINLNELIQIYIDDSLIEVKSSIYSNIEKRLNTIDNTEKIYEDLKFILENGVEYYKSQRTRKVLEILLIKLDDDYKYDYFNTFFYSKYSNDKKSAVKYIKYAKKDVAKELLKEYLSSGNAVFLLPLLDKKNLEFLAENITEIWYTEPSFFYKKRLIELLSQTKFKNLEFIENEEIDLYILACLISKKIKPKHALKLLSKVPESKRHFSIFNLSKELDYKFIECEMKKYIC